MKKLFNSPKSILIAFALFLFTSVSYSQPGLPGAGDGTGQNDEAPISSLVILGLVAGAAFGIKKLK